MINKYMLQNYEYLQHIYLQKSIRRDTMHTIIQKKAWL